MRLLLIVPDCSISLLTTDEVWNIEPSGYLQNHSHSKEICHRKFSHVYCCCLDNYSLDRPLNSFFFKSLLLVKESCIIYGSKYSFHFQLAGTILVASQLHIQDDPTNWVIYKTGTVCWWDRIIASKNLIKFAVKVVANQYNSFSHGVAVFSFFFLNYFVKILTEQAVYLQSNCLMATSKVV